ncbi:hypothetical protein [Streptomyces swartbergensis]|uniref:hypothetical protein n=1 Tax=Streptomyces swartbergensis TaxID=487165 RepID=UPI00381C1128
MVLVAAIFRLHQDDAMLYNSPRALLLCHYKREQALCHRTGMRDTPRLDHCVPRCGNIVRTTTTPQSCATAPTPSTDRPRRCPS